MGVWTNIESKQFIIEDKMYRAYKTFLFSTHVCVDPNYYGVAINFQLDQPMGELDLWNFQLLKRAWLLHKISYIFQMAVVTPIIME